MVDSEIDGRFPHVRNQTRKRGFAKAGVLEFKWVDLRFTGGRVYESWAI